MRTPNTVGGLIRTARETAGLTRLQLGQAIGLSEVAVRKIELHRAPCRQSDLLRVFRHPAMARAARLADG